MTESLIARLGLLPHPERGHYLETYRASARVHSPAHGGERAASTAIYFLISADQPATHLHRLTKSFISTTAARWRSFGCTQMAPGTWRGSG